MAQETQSRGRLIAIDGSRGADVAKAAESLAEELRQRGERFGPRSTPAPW